MFMSLKLMVTGFFQGPEWQTGENFECQPHIILMAIVQTPLQETK